MFSRADHRQKNERQSSPFLPTSFPSKPPLPSNKLSFLPRIQAKKFDNRSRNTSNNSSFSREDSQMKSNESNDISHISTNSNSSTQQKANFKKSSSNNCVKKKPLQRANSASSSSLLYIKTKPPKDISSKSWAVYNVNTAQLIYGKKHHQPREIASLTKIMTCYVCITLSKRMNMNLNEISVKITKEASFMNGTSANLQNGDQLKLIDLLYGLMLPSGNDAAYSLAENLGCLLFYEATNRVKLLEIIDNKYISLLNETLNINDPLKYFIHEMNKVAKELKLYNTQFANPHGLMNRCNKSTASDVAKLACTALKNPLFSQIVNTQLYEVYIKNHKTGIHRKEIWLNTNKLLEKGFNGVKTGVTDAAGPCLSASLKINKKDKSDIWVVAVILSCRSMEKRWTECQDLITWGVKEIINHEKSLEKQ